MNQLKNKQEIMSQLNEIVNVWSKKLNFSLVSLVFFSVMNLVNFVNPIFGMSSVIVLSVVNLVFLQQVIRAYNYLKYSKMNVRIQELIFDEIDN
jgi:hypothetical protein